MEPVLTEEQVLLIQSMDRAALLEAIPTAECGFPVDFTREYLDSLDLEQLRHLYLALRTRGRGHRH